MTISSAIYKDGEVGALFCPDLQKNTNHIEHYSQNLMNLQEWFQLGWSFLLNNVSKKIKHE